MSEEKKQELAQVNGEALAPSQGVEGLVPMLLPPGRVAASSLDLRTEAGQLLLQKCEEEEDTKLRELVNTPLAIVHVYCKWVDAVNEQTGEVRPYLRTCLIDDAGKVYACGSQGVASSLARFIAARKMPPWNPPVRCVVRLKVLRDGKQRMWLELLPTEKGKGAK